MEVPSLGVKLELKPMLQPQPCRIQAALLTYAAAFQQCQILNPLSRARDRTCILFDTSWVLNPLSHNGNSSAVTTNQLCNRWRRDGKKWLREIWPWLMGGTLLRGFSKNRVRTGRLLAREVIIIHTWEEAWCFFSSHHHPLSLKMKLGCGICCSGPCKWNVEGREGSFIETGWCVWGLGVLRWRVRSAMEGLDCYCSAWFSSIFFLAHVGHVLCLRKQVQGLWQFPKVPLLVHQIRCRWSKKVPGRSSHRGSVVNKSE